jgi:hypothetical protein
VGVSFWSKDVELEATDVLWTVHGEGESPNWGFCFCGLLFFFSLAMLSLMT